MKEAIAERARALGFDACRVTSTEPPLTGPHFKTWLAARFHGEMAYLERNAAKRTTPKNVLQNARSIITLATNYWLDRNRDAAGAGTNQARGVVARYARLDDYHDVLAERLQELAAFVNQLGGARTKTLWYVDTGPLLERDLAQRAGLGFIGKHTNLINRELGNWFFLSEIITTLALEPDAPEKNRCGSCARCLGACPTQAIRAPFQLDARRCISYLTIELKGSIPRELRPLMGNRIFGCDDCLEACPWNRFAKAAHSMRPHLRADLEAPELTELLQLDDTGFKHRFAGTPILRAKRRGLLRNVCVALGNIGQSSNLPALESAARDAEPLIAEHAQWAIEQIQGRTSTKTLDGASEATPTDQTAG